VTTEIQKFWKQHKKQLTDVRNLVLYLFAIIVLAITWSTIKTIQSNYDLQKQISVLKQQNDILDLQNQNTDLQNRYLQTDAYLDLAARQNLGLAGPGEKVLLVPKNVALKYVNSQLSQQSKITTPTVDTRPKYVKNIEDWRDFLLGRNPQQ
jgi:cell division protein FtsB